MQKQILNIFYEEPDPDRWFPYDRFIRKIIRRLVRGKQRPGGVMMVALELMKGLDYLGIPYRFNDYRYAKKHPNELIGVIGKPHILQEKKFKNPILFGAGIFSHPIEAPDLFEVYPNIQQVLVPGEWMQKMFEPYYGEKVVTWPVGIDTHKWQPIVKDNIEYDFLIYDKIRWDYDRFERELITPIKAHLTEKQLTYTTIKYGHYDHQELLSKLKRSKTVIFLCEHETQGLAYQQILATNTPILAWDKGGIWKDPYYFPERAKFAPVSAVPYWDERCGLKFDAIDNFPLVLEEFRICFAKGKFNPRAYILENLTLEICAQKYVDIYRSL